MFNSKNLVTKAYVVAERGRPFELKEVRLDGLESNEVLVEMKYTGVCHTDLVVQQGGMPIGCYPAVLGHEGIGTVVGIGAGVRDGSLVEGDTVVLSFHTCRNCRGCLEEQYGKCSHMTQTNFIDTGREGPSPISLLDGSPVHGKFFGQSSLSKLAVVSEDSVVKISAEPQDLVFLAPLGCGYLTGAGTVLNVLKPPSDSKVVVLGMGAVGLAAMLAAKTLGIEHLVAVDLSEDKLQLASSLGAEYTINTKIEGNLNRAVRERFPGGVDYIIDTTGVVHLLQMSIEALSHQGTLALVGVAPPTATFQVNPLDLLLSCKTIVGIVEGYSNPQKLIPQLLELYYSGRFPIHKISKCYPAEHLDKAIEDLKAGRVIKPVLSWQSID